MKKRINKLLVVSHVEHYLHQGRIYAHGPYASEIDLWADLFPQVLIASPCFRRPPDGDCLPLTRPNISMLPQMATGGDTLQAKALQFFALPLLILSLSRAMLRADAIHVRCPGNLGLLGAVLAPVFSRYVVAKYACQWMGHPGQSVAKRLQRAILRSPWWRGPVTVYGSWPGQPAHIVPFFTSSVTRDQLQRAYQFAVNRTPRHPLRILYVGRLAEQKRLPVLFQALAQLQTDGISFHCKIVGDGPLRPLLEALRTELGLQHSVEFAGMLGFDQVLQQYESADVLVLPSGYEGWGKAAVEAMAFGLVCVGAGVGVLPQILGDGRGVVVPPDDATALARELRRIALEPEHYQPMRIAAAEWAQRYSLEGLREALQNLLSRYWGEPVQTTCATIRL